MSDIGFIPGGEELSGLDGPPGDPGPQGPNGPDANLPYLPNPSYGLTRGLSPLASGAVTDWKEVDLSAGINFSGVPAPTLRYRRQGRRMVFRGTVNMTLGSSFILPVGFQPIGYEDSTGLLFPVLCLKSGVRSVGYVLAKSVAERTAAGRASLVKLEVGPTGTSLVTGWDSIGWFCNDFDSANPPGTHPFPGSSRGYPEPLSEAGDPQVVGEVPPHIPSFVNGAAGRITAAPPIG